MELEEGSQDYSLNLKINYGFIWKKSQETS